MIAVQVTYKVKADFVEENKRNIKVFLEEFKGMLASKFLYNVYIKKDGLTFVHVSMYENEAVQQQILNTPSFVFFQQKRDEYGIDGIATIEEMEHIGSSLRLVK